ncbi:MAG: hypothetical protein JW795_12650 [Chitinivibrionales bacterium]|nr:hypothetical protein [Chitinivibrionales bacterium]
MKNYVRYFIQLFVVSFVLFFSRCINDSGAVIDIKYPSGTIYGCIYGATAQYRVILTLESDTIKTVIPNLTSGTFLFMDIPFGHYHIIVSDGKYFSIREFFHREIQTLIEPFELNFSNNLIRTISPRINDTIKPNNISSSEFTYIIKMEFRSHVSFSQQPGSIRIVPNALQNLLKVVQTPEAIALFLPVDTLFKNHSSTLHCSIDVNVMDTAGTVKKDTIVLTFPIDSTGFNACMNNRFIEKIWPGWGMSDFPLEDSIDIVFSHPMIHASVENSIRIAPHIAMNFFWDNNRVVCSPVNSLPPATQCTLTIGTDAMTCDSFHFRRPYTIIFMTETRSFFSDYWPLDSSKDVEDRNRHLTGNR